MGLSLRDLARSTTARFVGLHLLNSLVGSAVILLLAFHLTNSLLRSDLRDLLAREAQAVEFQFRAEGPASAAREVQRLLGSETRRSAVILLADPRGRVIAGNLEAWPATVPSRTQWRELRLFPVNSDRSRLVGVTATALPGGYRLLTGYELTTVESLRAALTTALFFALALGVVFGLGGGALLARFVNRRVAAIGTLAERFASGAHTERLAVEGRRDPFDRLAHALNSMLDRIEHLVEELRLTTDGLAHDLRSPLVRLRARGEQALAAADSPDSQAAIEAILQESDTLLRMLAVMLEISRAEAGLGRDMIAAVDLASLARDVVEMYEPLAEERSVALVYGGEADLIWPANRELLGQALANLIDNALNHGSGQIEVEAHRRGNCACLSVSDRGEGIPAERREEALQRFGRLDPARGKEGAGLGLALVNAIARMHGGRLDMADNAPGLRVTIELPSVGAR